MPRLRENRVLRLPARLLQRLDHLVTLRLRHHVVLRPVIAMQRHILEPHRRLRLPTATNRHRRRQHVRIFRKESPRPEPAHAQPSHHNPAPVHRLALAQVIHQLLDLLHIPPPTRRTLRRRHDERIQRLLLPDQLRRPVLLHLLKVVTPLTSPMQKNHQRPARLRLLLLSRRQRQPVTQLLLAPLLVLHLKRLRHLFPNLRPRVRMHRTQSGKTGN